MSKLQGAISQAAANLTSGSAALADGGTDTGNTVTFTGAVVGDPAFVSFSDLPAGCIAQAHVSAADTVTVSIVNASGANADVSDVNVVIAVLH